jgi:hypothetical protein
MAQGTLVAQLHASRPALEVGRDNSTSGEEPEWPKSEQNENKPKLIMEEAAS